MTGEALAAFWSVLQAELPQQVSARLEVGGDEAVALQLLDRMVREGTALALQHLGQKEAAQAVRALPPITGEEAARGVMISLEKVGRAHGAPSALFRAAGGGASTVLMLARAPKGEDGRRSAALRQMAFAVVRLVEAVRKAGVPDVVLADVLGPAALAEPGERRALPP